MPAKGGGEQITTTIDLGSRGCFGCTFLKKLFFPVAEEGDGAHTDPLPPGGN